MDETTTASMTSVRAARGGGRVEKMGAQKSETKEEEAEAGAAAIRRQE